MSDAKVEYPSRFTGGKPIACSTHRTSVELFALRRCHLAEVLCTEPKVLCTNARSAVHKKSSMGAPPAPVHGRGDASPRQLRCLSHLVRVRTIPLCTRAFAAYPRCACGIPRSLVHSLLMPFFGLCRKAMGDEKRRQEMSDSNSVQTIGEYVVPVDPMDLLQCDSCQ
jgi:hypothetical protein